MAQHFETIVALLCFHHNLISFVYWRLLLIKKSRKIRSFGMLAMAITFLHIFFKQNLLLEDQSENDHSLLGEVIWWKVAKRIFVVVLLIAFICQFWRAVFRKRERERERERERGIGGSGGLRRFLSQIGVSFLFLFYWNKKFFFVFYTASFQNFIWIDVLKFFFYCLVTLSY